MPLRDYSCLGCDLQQERFYHSTEDPHSLTCKDCGSALGLLQRSDEGRRRFTGVFPFTTTHINANGTPMVIENMAHLRSVERQYGVALTAFHNEENNSVDGLTGDLPLYRGWEIEKAQQAQRRR